MRRMQTYTSPLLMYVGRFSDLTRGGCCGDYDRRGHDWMTATTC